MNTFPLSPHPLMAAIPHLHGDTRIARSAQSALRWMTHFPPEWVRVLVNGGAITLSGEVDATHQRQAATGAVRYLDGVTGVVDNITVRPEVPSGPLKTDTERALKRRAAARVPNVHIEVRGRDVTLSGPVHSRFERERARHAAWGTQGVRYVYDNLVATY